MQKRALAEPDRKAAVVTHSQASESADDCLPDRLIIVAREGWGNTDFLEFGRASAGLGVDVRFVGYPAARSVDFNPPIHSPSAGVGPLAFTREAAQICRRLLCEDRSKVTAIHVRYYKSCALLPSLVRARAALDIRSASIRESAVVRALENRLIRAEAFAFDLVTVVSSGLGGDLGLRRFRELPLGAPGELLAIPRDRKLDPTRLRFLYIGTLRQRNLHVFAAGFADFIAREGLDWRLDLYGYGSDEDLNRLNMVSRRCTKVRFHGPLARTEVPQQLAEADVGVSFVPITPYFDRQPPTKTYEYLMAGLPTLATRTAGNAEIVTDGRGWLCDDTAASVEDALARIQRAKAVWTVNRDALRDRTWEAIFAQRYRREILSRSVWVTQ